MKSPLAPWLSAWRPAWLRADLAAGLSVSAVVIPQAMAYAAIAGLPVASGLYAALAAMAVYPLLGSSRPLSVTTTSSLAMLTATAVAAVAGRGGGGAVVVAATLAALVGATLIAARVLRLGFVANFISKPVLIGFAAGVGIAILIGQLGPALGLAVRGHGTIGTLAQVLKRLPQAHWPTLAVSIAGILVLTVLPRLAPKVPSALVWVAVAIAASALLNLRARGVALVGAAPAGLPPFSLPDLALAGALWPGAVGIALMSFTEGMAAARTFRRPADPLVDANRELLAAGAANLAASFIGGMPCGGGTSQTAVAEDAGVKSQAAQWVGAAAVIATLLLLGPFIAVLPKAALAALILVAAVGMIKPATFREIARIRPDEAVWSLATVAGVIVLGTLNGILVAVAISVLALAYQANHPPVYALAWSGRHGVFRRQGAHTEDETFPGLLMVRTEGRLTFASAPHVRDQMAALVASARPQVIILECSAIPDIEYTALLSLIEDEAALRRAGTELWLAAVNPVPLAVIRRSPLAGALGAERLFYDLAHALEVWRGRPAPGGANPAPTAGPPPV